MLTKERGMEIRILRRQGQSIRQISKTLGVSRNTVRRYLRSDVLPSYQREIQRPSKLDPHKAYLVGRVAAARPHWLPATVLLSEIRGRGYRGGISILRDFLRNLKPVAKPEPLRRFETEPGEHGLAARGRQPTASRHHRGGAGRTAGAGAATATAVAKPVPRSATQPHCRVALNRPGNPGDCFV